jgi:hypothetical protein
MAEIRPDLELTLGDAALSLGEPLWARPNLVFHSLYCTGEATSAS